ncbi:MAG: S1C family serine protease [Acidimicrobiales bacterium]
METNSSDPNESGPEADAASGPESPTNPGIDETQPSPSQESPNPSPGQPKWQPLPEGNWSAPSPTPTPPPPPWSGANGAPGYGPPGYGAPGYGPPGYGPPGYGPPGYGPPGYGPGSPGGPGAPGGHNYYPGYSSPGSPVHKPRGSRYLITIIAAIVVLVAATATAGVLLGTASHHTQTGATSASTKPIPQPSPLRGTSSAKLNVSTIASKIDPATVDITSMLGTQNAQAEGTGMILTSNGEVLTNNHVIQGATAITAQVDGVGQKYTVKVLGVDPKDDVALVLLQGASNLPHVSIGNSSAVTVGDPVVAIGNALGLGGTPTVTSGIVSALNRSITASDAGTGLSEHLTGLLQTDAPINPGNSGGPLVNASGQVIGMDTAAASGSATQSASNIGFAIPINRAISIATKIQQGKASSTILLGTRGIIGVDVVSIQTAEQPNMFGATTTLPVSYGAVVLQVLSGSPAARAGIAPGNVIIDLNGARVSSDLALGKMLANHHPGDTVTLTWVAASGTRHTASVTLEPGPAA